MIPKQRFIAVFVLLLILVFTLTVSAKVVNRIAAIVDDNIITLHEVQQVARPIIQSFANSPEGRRLTSEQISARVKEIKKKVLKELIESKLVETEVNRLGIPVSDGDVDDYIERIKRVNGLTDESLSATLLAEGSSMSEFREKIKKQILREQYIQYRLKNKIEITEDEAKAYYKQNQEDFVAERIITLSELRISLPPESSEEQILATRERINTLYTQLLSGGDFAELAKRHSDGPTASSGGSLGSWKIKTELAESYRKAAEQLNPGDLATPYRDEKGFVILKCDSWEQSGFLSYKVVADKIKIFLRKEASERAMKDLAKELYKKSFVDIKIEEF